MRSLVSGVISLFILYGGQSLWATVPAPVMKWQYGGFSKVEFNKGMYASPAMIDVDGDGVEEIVYANFKVYAINGKTGQPVWEFYTLTDKSNPTLRSNVGTDTSVMVGDINGDGADEIVTAHSNGSICAYSRTGYLLPGFPVQPAGRTETINSACLFDLDHDGRMEIILGWGVANPLNVCVLEGDGSIRAGWPQYTNSDNANALGIYGSNIAVGDINHDSFGEIIVPSDTGKTCAYNKDGVPLPTNALFGANTIWPKVVNYEDYSNEKLGYALNAPFYMGTDYPATIADVDGNGSYEIILVPSVFTNSDLQPMYCSPFIYNLDRTRFKISAWNWEGNLPKTGAPLTSEWNVIPIKRTNPVTVDLDGDGKAEILTSTYDGKVNAYWLDKTQKYNWPVSVYMPAEGVFRFASEPAVADLDSDGKMEVVFTTWPQYYSGRGGDLYIVSAGGQVLRKTTLPYGTNGAVGERNFDGGLACPTIADIDGDGEAEILVASVYGGLIAYDLPGSRLGACPWPTGRHDYARTGWTGFVQCPTCSTSIPCTIKTSPTGLKVTVDGTVYLSPHTFYWASGTTHTLSVSSPQSGAAGTRYLYYRWYPGGAQTHSIIVPASASTHLASFATQYSLTTTSNPLAGGTMTPAGTTWYNKGQSVLVRATSKAGYIFTGWSGSLAGWTNPATVVMNGPMSITGNFASGSALLAPVLVQPANGATGQPFSATLTWQDKNSSPQELNYKVRIKPAGGAYKNYILAANTTSYITATLLVGKTYSWNVQARGNGTTIKISPWANGGVDFKFTTKPPVTLNMPTLVTPANYATGQPTSVTLKWLDTNTSTQELSYRIRIKPAGGGYAYITVAANTISYLRSGLARNKTYLWSVQAKGNGTSIKDSAFPVDWRFTTAQ